jgi:spore germination cell wall hydrolase CwlJ-like protein
MRGFVSGIALVTAITAVTSITRHKLDNLESQYAAQGSEFISVKERERQLKCMADNIYYEAATEPAEGKLAVGIVVMNRVAHPAFPKDPCQVIYQRNSFYQIVVCQFSWLCDGSVGRRPVQQKLYNESMDAAKMVLLEGFRMPSLKDALFYHADYVNPQWGKTQVAKIGRHIFYKQPEKTNGRA